MERVLDMKTVSGDGNWVVSTVALLSPDVRLLDTFFAPERLSDTFETMVFPADEEGGIGDFGEHYRCGYSEIIEARIGHELAVHEINAGTLELYPR